MAELWMQFNSREIVEEEGTLLNTDGDGDGDRDRDRERR